ncbi:MAG TPA: NADH-quinone oxidoreductase subunit K, partial [Spirochaetia bacterium]
MNGGVWTIAMVAVLCLVAIGIYGLLVTRNLIKIVVALQVFAKGTILVMVAAGGISGKPAIGQSLAITVI